MIRVKAAGFPQFFAAHAVLRAAGVEVVAAGGNEMRVPDGTDVAVLRAVAATGAVVHADIGAPAEPSGSSEAGPPAEEPAPKPRKTATRRKTRE